MAGGFFIGVSMVHADDCGFAAFTAKLSDVINPFDDVEITINTRTITVLDTPTAQEARLDVRFCPSCGVKTAP